MAAKRVQYYVAYHGLLPKHHVQQGMYSHLYVTRVTPHLVDRHHESRSALESSCACHAADGCKVNVHLWETWTPPRWTHASTKLLEPCASAKSCSGIVPKKWPQPVTMPCFRGALALQCYSFRACGKSGTSLRLPLAVNLAAPAHFRCFQGHLWEIAHHGIWYTSACSTLL